MFWFNFLLALKLLSLCHAKNVVLLLADDAGFESEIYNNSISLMPNLSNLAKFGKVFTNAYTSVSSCSPSRASLLTGMPQHQNGMYGLQNSYHHFISFENIPSLPNILSKNHVFTGLIGKKHVAPSETFAFDYEQTEQDYSIEQIGRNITFMKLKIKEFFELYLDLLSKGERYEGFFLMVAFHDPHRCSKHMELGPFCDHFGDGTPISIDNRELLRDILLPSPNFLNSEAPDMINDTLLIQRFDNIIPDWKPTEYDPSSIQSIPYFIPDTAVNRKELAAQYKTISRLDQGIGLVLKELKAFLSRPQLSLLNGTENEKTLVLYMSDNGIPFPFGRTNLYQPGIKVPLIATILSTKRNTSETFSSPHQRQSFLNSIDLPNNVDGAKYDIWPAVKKDIDQSELPIPPRNKKLFNLIDDYVVISYEIMPAILDWFKIKLNNPRNPSPSLIALLIRGGEENEQSHDTLTLLSKGIELRRQNPSRYIFFSQSLHEITMFYPMRSVIDTKTGFKLIHNLRYESRFRIDTDFYASHCFQEILQNSSTIKINGKTLNEYYYRPRWEMYNIMLDPFENHNLLLDNDCLNNYTAVSENCTIILNIFIKLKESLVEWQNRTRDPWLCDPDGVLIISSKPQSLICYPL